MRLGSEGSDGSWVLIYREGEKEREMERKRKEKRKREKRRKKGWLISVAVTIFSLIFTHLVWI